MAVVDGEYIVGEKDDGELLVPCAGHWPGNMAPPPPLMAMLIFLACSSWAAAAALLAAAFFTLSALPLVSTSRRFSSAAHSAFDMPGGFVFFARIFLAGAFGGILVDERTRRRVVVDEKTPPGTGAGRRGDWGISAGENGDMQANWREWGYASKLEGKST